MKIKTKSILFVWFIVIFSAFGAEINWSGKWHVNWTAGAFVLNLEQHNDEINGTFEPAHGILRGKVKGTVLDAVTVNKNGVKNKIKISISDSGESFFGRTQFGNWITGIRVDSKNNFNTIAVDQSTPMKAFYSFLELSNAVRSGNYDVMEKVVNIIHFSQKQKSLRYANKLNTVNNFLVPSKKLWVTKK